MKTPLTAALLLATACSLETGLPVPVARECSIPVQEEVHHVPKRGCWRMTAEPGHGFSLTDPGAVTCEDGLQCLVVPPESPFWTIGAGKNEYKMEDVACDEECPR